VACESSPADPRLANVVWSFSSFDFGELSSVADRLLIVEQEIFHTQKNSGLNLEHAYSTCRLQHGAGPPLGLVVTAIEGVAPAEGGEADHVVRSGAMPRLRRATGSGPAKICAHSASSSPK